MMRQRSKASCAMLWMSQSLPRAQTPAEDARKPRKPTLASVAKAASKAGIPVVRYEMRPDGTIIVVTGEPEASSTEPNPWLAEIEKATKQ